MRRAVLAILLCAGSLSAGPAAAAPTPDEQAALKAAVREERSRAAAPGIMPLPLPSPERIPSRTARVDPALASAASGGRALVGVRSHADLAPLRRSLVRLGARVQPVEEVAVLIVEGLEPGRLASALRADPRAAYVERDRTLRLAAEPFDAPDPETGIPFTWAFDAVRAGEALTAAGGGSRRSVAVIDTGLDVAHPDLAGRIGATYDISGSGSVTDNVGHGTFVAGLLSAIDGNGIGGKGVAGQTAVVPVRASLDGSFTESAFLLGVRAAVRSRARILNMSLAGEGFSRTAVRALDTAFFNDVLPVAASGNHGDDGNPLEYPAAAIGGVRGRRGIGLSVAAVRPDSTPARFSAHNPFVSLAAPGAGPSCPAGVFSTIPGNQTLLFDQSPSGCRRSFSTGPGGRYGYAQGTSFASPLAAGLAALVWQVERKLKSEQVGHVLMRTARKIGPGRRWNEFTGTGVVDGAAAVGLARTYDTTPPRARASARKQGVRVRVLMGRSRDRSETGHELAGGVRYTLLRSTDNGRSFRVAVRSRRSPIRRSVGLLGGRRNLLVASACDRNGNCGLKRLGRFSR